MAKASSVKIQVDVLGDGVNDTFFKEMANATAPGGGPTAVSLTMGQFTTLNVPAGAKGVVLSPGTATEFEISNIGGGSPLALTPTASHYFAFDASTLPVPNTLYIFSTSGGTVLVQWT